MNELRRANLKLIILACAMMFLFTACTVPDLADRLEPYLSGDAMESPMADSIGDAGDAYAGQQDAAPKDPHAEIQADGAPYVYDAVQYGDILIPGWDGERSWVEINGGTPFFTDEEKGCTEAFETYSELDDLGRCGVAYANICIEIMPTETRGEIGSVKPSGWHTVKYNDLISGNYLYNRCHLIGYQLAGENANPENLITGTRYLNINGMLSFENHIDDYVESLRNHVLYRVTPVFVGDELVCRGVVMEGWSVEDSGQGTEFCVFAYNVQPGIGIDYATGESWRLDGKTQQEIEEGPVRHFVLNTKSGKFHLESCKYAADMSEKNRLEVDQTLDAMFEAGYVPCGSCKPDENEE